MPTMPRTSKQARKIAYRVLGKPLNMRKKSKWELKLDKLLRYQAASVIR